MLDTPIQNKIVAMKYAYKRPDGTKEKDWDEVVLRTVTALTNDSKRATAYYNLINELVFMPGGRILANAGTGIKSLMNCYSLGLSDSRQSIYATLKEAAEVFAHGGGVGYNFSNIREEGAPIISTGGQACLTGDTVVYKDRTKKSVAENIVTLEKLFLLKQKRKDLIPLIAIRCMDEATHTLFKNNIVDIVCNGLADVYTLETVSGYKIRATTNHRFMTDNFEYQELSKFTVGDKIAVNGMSFCEHCGKPIYGKHLCLSCHNKNQVKSTALATTARQRKQCRNAAKDFCEMCTVTNKRFEIHHIDQNVQNNSPENLLNLCPKCHQGLHAALRAFGNPYRQKYVTLDTISKIEYAGQEIVYDLQMSHPNHNFVANGLISHNSGPLSFLSLFDQTGEVIQQASRRGAQLACLNVDHFDIEKFIDFKSTLNYRNQRIISEYLRNLEYSGLEEDVNSTKVFEKTLQDDQLTHFNVSVGITDEFMKCVVTGEPFELKSVVDSKVVRKVNAKELLHKIALRAWESGDPGLLFLDTANANHMVPYMGRILNTNPCLVGDTLIRTEAGEVEIQELVGKEVNVYCMDSDGNSVLAKATNIIKTKENASLVNIRTSDNTEITCTPDHQFYTRNRGYVEASELNLSDVLYDLVDDVHISRVMLLIHKEDVYDMQVPGYNNFVANGIVVHNCGEVPLLPYESCCLGSLNLAKFVEEPVDEGGYKVNWEFLEYATRHGIRFLDDVQSVSEAPLEPINVMSKGLRRLGLGVCGFADLLAEMEIPYNSDSAFELANYISWFISFMAWQESFAMAEEKGAFEYYDKDKVNLEPLRRVFESQYVPYDFDYHRPVRNVAVTSLAPTGSISLVAGVNSGIEPFFALAYKRNITQGIGNTATDYVIELNPILFRKLKKYNVPEADIEKIKEYVLEKGTVQGCDLVPEKLRKVFVTSHEITPEEHIEMQASWQEYVSNSVSKTINLPHDATVEDVEQAIVLMWYHNLVGGTLYRDNSKFFQVLNVGNKK
jgi:ribonucleotide reductase alpha subunit